DGRGRGGGEGARRRLPADGDREHREVGEAAGDDLRVDAVGQRGADAVDRRTDLLLRVVEVGPVREVRGDRRGTGRGRGGRAVEALDAPDGLLDGPADPIAHHRG